MALGYRITKRSNNIGNKENSYNLQTITKGTIDIDTLNEHISSECTLHSLDVKAVLIALGTKLDFYLKDGKIVDMGDVGKFKMGFKGTAAKKPAILSVKNIEKLPINYQPSLKLKRQLKEHIDVLKEDKK